MIEILDYDIFHTQEGARKEYQLCNIVNDDEFDIHHMITTGEVRCIFTETGYPEEEYNISKTKEIYVRNKSGKMVYKMVPKTIIENLM